MKEFDFKLLPDDVLPKALKLIEIGKGSKCPPPILLSGPTGTGKTSLALYLSKILCTETLIINCNSAVNTSYLSSVERFCSSTSLENLNNGVAYKCVIFDEMDNTRNDGEVLRPLLDKFKNKVFFIGTTNHLNKLAPSVQSRFLNIDFSNGIDIRQMLLQQELGI